jgi:hypothetical protein
MLDRLRDQCIIEQYGTEYRTLALYARWQGTF